jgi:hypothetical protein
MVRVDLAIHRNIIQFMLSNLETNSHNRETARRAGVCARLISLLRLLEEDVWPPAQPWVTRGGISARVAYQKEVRALRKRERELAGAHRWLSRRERELEHERRAEEGSKRYDRIKPVLSSPPRTKTNQVAALMGLLLVKTLNHHTARADLLALLPALQHSGRHGWLQPLLVKALTARASSAAAGLLITDDAVQPRSALGDVNAFTPPLYGSRGEVSGLAGVACPQLP